MIFLKIILVGLMATAIMSVFLSLVHKRGWANGDMIRAVGSAITRSDEGALIYGLIVHFSLGAFFAFFYSFCLNFSPAGSFFSVIAVCTAVGFFHGLLMILLTIIIVAEHHPLERFRRLGPDAAIAHLIAHILYGICVGLGLALLGIRGLPIFEA